MMIYSDAFQTLDARAQVALTMQNDFRGLAEAIQLFQKNVENRLKRAMDQLIDKEQEINKKLHELHAKVHQ